MTATSVRLPENFREWPVGMQSRFRRFAIESGTKVVPYSNSPNPKTRRSVSSSAIA